MLTVADFFDVSDYAHAELFRDSRVTYVWDVLKLLREYLGSVIKPEIHGQVMSGAHLMGDKIFIGSGSVVEPGAVIKGPAYIGRDTQVRHGAYVREWVLVGDHCVIGHTTEIKDTIMLDHAHAAHFAYLGDSIIGNHVNLGAGSKLANLKLDRSNIVIRVGDQTYDTGMRKLGAIVGDRVQTGCNSVSNPGTLLGPDCIAYALTLLRGYYPPGTMIKLVSSLQLTQLQSRPSDG